MNREMKKVLQNEVYDVVLDKVYKYGLKQDLSEYFDNEFFEEERGKKTLRMTLYDNRFQDADLGEVELYFHFDIQEPTNVNESIRIMYRFQFEDGEEVEVPLNAIKLFATAEKLLERFNKKRNEERNKKQQLENLFDETIDNL